MAVLVSHFPAKWGLLLSVSPPETPCFLTCVSDQAPLSLLSNTKRAAQKVSALVSWFPPFFFISQPPRACKFLAHK